jgi:sugar phosphate isomerase/epimerase
MGLQGVELDLGSHEHGLPLRNGRIQTAYDRARRRAHIEYPSIAVNALLNHGLTNPPDSEAGRLGNLAVETAVRVAADMNIPVVQVPSFEDGAIRDEAGLQNTVRHLAQACDLAETVDVIIATENLLSAAENRRLIDLVGGDRLRVFFDLQNPHLVEGYHVPDMLRDLMPFVVEVHAKDGVDTMSSAMLGQGASDFAQSAEVLREAEFSGWVHLENYYDRYPLSERNDDPYELLAEDLAILRAALNGG